MKNLEKREVRSHNKVRALIAENKVRFARAEQLWIWYSHVIPSQYRPFSRSRLTSSSAP